jgi:hypothetical protein
LLPSMPMAQGLPEDGISSSAHHPPHPPSADDEDASILSPDDQQAADKGREASPPLSSQSRAGGSSEGQQGGGGGKVAGESEDWDVSESLKQLAQLQQNVEDTFGIKSPGASSLDQGGEQEKEGEAEEASRRSELSRGMTLKALAAMAPPGSPLGGLSSFSLGGGIRTKEEEQAQDFEAPDSPVLASVRRKSLQGRLANSGENSSKRPPTGKSPASMSFDMALTPPALERHASGDAPVVMQRNMSDPISRLQSSASSAVHSRSRRGSEQFDEIRASKTVPRLRWPGSTAPSAAPAPASGGNTPVGATPRFVQHGGAPPMLAAVHHGNASPMFGSRSPRAR